MDRWNARCLGRIREYIQHGLRDLLERERFGVDVNMGCEQIPFLPQADADVPRRYSSLDSLGSTTVGQEISPLADDTLD